MGKFEIFKQVGTKQVKIGESNNRILYGGRMYALDTVFGLEAWQSGVAGWDGSLPASGAWSPYRTIVIGSVGDDNLGWFNTNGYLEEGSGLSGGGIPTGGDGFGHLPNANDAYMSSAASGGNANFNLGTGLFYKLADRTIRVGRTVSIEATFQTDANPANGSATTIPVGVEIRELGVSLSDNPTGLIDPATERTSRPHVLICKSVRYEVSGGLIHDNPIVVGLNNITVRYTFGDVS